MADSDRSAGGSERVVCQSCGMPMVGRTEKGQVHQAILHAITTDGDHVVSDEDLVERYDRLDTGNDRDGED